MSKPRYGTFHRSSRSGSALAAVGTTIFHAGAFFLVFAAVPTQEPGPEVYAVQLLAAPEIPERERPETVQRQAEPPPPAEPDVQEAPPDEPEPPPPEPEVEQEPIPEAATEVELAPDEEPSTGDDVATVDSPGLDFPFPGYLRNIVSQIYRRWQRPSSNAPLRAEIMFIIQRDGSIGNSIRFVVRSGNFAFDLNAQGAIEAAGASGAFGPLPEGYPNDVLPVQFSFDPSGISVSR